MKHPYTSDTISKICVSYTVYKICITDDLFHKDNAKILKYIQVVSLPESCCFNFLFL